MFMHSFSVLVPAASPDMPGMSDLTAEINAAASAAGVTLDTSKLRCSYPNHATPDGPPCSDGNPAEEVLVYGFDPASDFQGALISAKCSGGGLSFFAVNQDQASSHTVSGTLYQE